jgi:predicted amidohydrolase YtcJ
MTHNVMRALLALMMLQGMGAAAATPEAIYLNGHVWTGDAKQPTAQAIAIADGSIVAVGSSDEVRKLATPSTRVVDLKQAPVVPGFIDNHVHFVSGGLALDQVDLRDAATPAEFSRRIARAAARLAKGRWITDGNWDHETWGGQLPTRDWIDKDTPATPVFVSRLDGHMALANSVVLKLAGIDEKTPDPAGGTTDRRVEGRRHGAGDESDAAAVGRGIGARSATSDGTRGEPWLDPSARHGRLRRLQSVGVVSTHAGQGQAQLADLFLRADRRVAASCRIQTT